MIKLPIIVVALATILLGIAVMAAGPGYRFGFWQLGTAFDILQTAGPWLAYAGGASLLGLVVGVITRQRGTLTICLLAIAISGGLTYSLVEQRKNARAHPIHDVTTDVTDPPAIIAAAGLERRNPPDYSGDAPYKETGKSVIEWQRDLYPDISPLVTRTAPAKAFTAARDTAAKMGWDILAQNDASGTIEAAYTSPWFGFVDDVIVRVRPVEDGGSRIDIRSKSRVGGSDLGANAKRIRVYKSKLAAQLVTP